MFLKTVGILAIRTVGILAIKTVGILAMLDIHFTRILPVYKSYGEIPLYVYHTYLGCMTETVYDVWNEVRISESKIGISLIAEGDGGATVEDEFYIDLDDIQSASGLIDNLRLRQTTRDALIGGQ